MKQQRRSAGVGGDGRSIAGGAVVIVGSNKSDGRPALLTATATRDDVYCHLLARRAVVRAGLYLGIDCMSQEALDTLAGVLLEYLSRIGSTLASTVEASGRSSAHCNALDALRVIELVTTPSCCPATIVTSSSAANTVGASAATGPATGSGMGAVSSRYLLPSQSSQGSSHLDDGIMGNLHHPDADDHNHYGTSHQYHPEAFTSWKDLAAFCFGPHWRETASTRQQQHLLNLPQRQNNIDITTTTSAPATGLLNPSNSNMRADGTGSESGGRSGASGGKQQPEGGASGNSLLIDSNGSNGSAGGNNLIIKPGGENAHNIIGGWNAPYPDEVPAFPICPERTTANPHTLPEQRFHSSYFIPPRTSLHQNNEGSSSEHHNIKDVTLFSADDHLSHHSIAASIERTQQSLTDIPDDVFAATMEKRDFFSPRPLLHGEERHRHETANLLLNKDSSLSTGSTATNIVAASGSVNASTATGSNITSGVAGGMSSTTSATNSSGSTTSGTIPTTSNVGNIGLLTTPPSPSDSATNKNNKKDDIGDANKKKVKFTSNMMKGTNDNGPSTPRFTGENNIIDGTPTSPFSAAAAAAKATVEEEWDRRNHPLYVPKFYPPFPPPRPSMAARTFVDLMFDSSNSLETNQTTTASHDDSSSTAAGKTSNKKRRLLGFVESGSALHDTDTTRSVRSALIKLGKQYEWGTFQWHDDAADGLFNDNKGNTTKDGDGTDSKKKTIQTSSLAVSAGRSGDAAASSTSSVGASSSATPIIVPLNRASGSRVSRILEGSMDAAAIQ